MRRLLIALLLIPSLAEARGMVVVSRVRNSAFSAGITNRQQYQADYAESLALQALDRFNVDYAVVPSERAKTEFCRTGKMVWDYGTSSAVVEQFAWVLHVSYPGKLAKSARWPFPGYRPDSLHMSALGGCTVPQLFWNMQINGVTPNTFLADTTGDTTGIGPTVSLGINGPNGCIFSTYSVSHTGHRFLASSYISTPNTLAPFVPSVGFRVLSGRRSGDTAVITGLEQAMFSGGSQTCAWADSGANFTTPNVATDGEAEIWEMPFSNIAGSKPCVFAQVWGVAGCTDSSGTTAATPCEWDTQNALYSLARIDSLTGGGVFGRSLGLGVVIKGGFKYANVGSPRGISPADTTALWRTLDSLATLGSRFRCLVTADMDSVWTLPSHKSQWEKLAGLRYAPTAEACVYDSSSTVQCRGAKGNRWLWPMDVFGRQHKRAAFGMYQDSTYVYNPDAFRSSLQADSSIYVQVRSLFFHADSTFGRERVSRFLVPPGDDWFPLANTAAFPADSIYTALRRAGAVGLLFNSQRRTTPTESRGHWNVGEESIVNTLDRKPFLLLGHSGHAIHGARRSFDVRSDSADWAAGICQEDAGAIGEQYTFPAYAAYEVHRAINQLVLPRYRDFGFMPNRWPDSWDDVNTPADDRIYGIRRGSVWVTSAQDLGGGGHLAAGYSATRPAWWTIKSLDQFFLALNKQAGRTVIKWEWPEMISP